MSGFKYLTFDCYGTLIDWRTGIEIALRRALGRLPVTGRSLSEAYVDAEREEEGSYKKYRVVLANTSMRLSRSLGIEIQRTEAEEFANSVPDWPPFKDSAGSLRDLGRQGYKRYILSNVDTDLLEETISRNRLEVDGFVTAEEIGSYKPERGHWLEFMSRTGAKKDETLHVAQSVFHDIVPAGKLGFASAWVNRYREPMPDGIRPLYVCDDLQSLTEILAESRRETAI